VASEIPPIEPSGWSASNGRWIEPALWGSLTLMLHAGFIPSRASPTGKPFLDTLLKVSDLAKTKGVTIAFETGQETADLMRLTLNELKCPNLKVNFDRPTCCSTTKATPLRAARFWDPIFVASTSRTLTARLFRAIGVKKFLWAKAKSTIRQFIKTLQKVGYRGPLCIERSR